ncbi:lipopolysaccharide-induced tumor necrosis factor-alpha factor homolog isoform X1 [Silurus meridionalis]|uniref:lipopolysaccharide-induced tumor necrosis factor-alpha factor homolog isoform X1 n=1 Tax=Silurus meridionalis TaxID=175797 RepID=UPI001EEAF05E|nr:lipopolysaccharide-induced tumor necrosis factor-alpha factor homolog isoform X1 [Silurus meridionalis]
MDFPGATSDSAVVFTPPLPSYSEAVQNPQPSSPPPTYGEAVGVLPVNTTVSPYPILSIPTETTQPYTTPHNSTRPTHTVFVQPSHHQLPQWQQQQQQGGSLGPAPTVTTCPHCQHQITTSVRYRPGGTAWATCCLLTVVGLVCGFCLIPCCLKEFQDAYHSCPACKNYLGVYIR